MEATELKAGNLVRHKSNDSAPTMIITRVITSDKTAYCTWWDVASRQHTGKMFELIELDFISAS